MSEQIIAYGATVERSTDDATYTEIPECKGIAIPVVTIGSDLVFQHLM